MEHIFGDMRQAVRFAFALDAYPIGSKGAAVRLALADAEVTQQPELPAGADAEALRAYADRVLVALRSTMLAEEGAALAARYACNMGERGRAVITLHPLMCNLLSRLVDNRSLVRKLLDRHYTPAEERGQCWELYLLANEFKFGHERVRRAAQALDDCTHKLEVLALRTLQETLAATTAKPAQPKAAEVCHA
jgi:hypothetical protein